MPLLSLERASLAYGHLPLLDTAALQIDAGERIALIGRNGAGKSSLLQILAGQLPLDDGSRWCQPGLRLAYVAQEPALDASLSVFDAVVTGMGEVSQLLRQYHHLSLQLAADDSDHAPLLQQLAELQHQLENRGAWDCEARAQQVIDRFGLDSETMVGTLSGGQKKRLALAQALAANPDLLLLDEPTNHLDIAAIEWLEEFLLSCNVTLFFITHDRRFLDRLASRIVALDRGQLSSYPGNFSAYQTRRQAELANEASDNARFDKLLKEEESWIRQGVEARRTRAAFRVQRLEQLRTARAARRERLGQVSMQLAAGDKSGQLVAELQHAGKAFGDKIVVADFSCRILRGDRIGLIGPNGAGKTTLLRLLLGELEPDQGTVRLGSKLEVAYFDQFRAQLDEEATLADTISPGSEFIEIDGRRRHVIGYLGEFLFPPQRARSPVKSLSGGERNRLLLARLFARPANLLVLDEPTNDLDIDTLELLESLLQEYPGTVLLVSHDRAFLDAIVTQVIAAESDKPGHWREYAGGYSDWAAYQASLGTLTTAKPATAKTARRREPQKADTRLSWKETRELEALPDTIAALEAEQTQLSRRLEDSTLYQDPAAAQQVAERLANIDTELLTLLERWEALESRQA